MNDNTIPQAAARRIMQPMEALNVLDQCTGMVALKRADHDTVQIALLSLRTYIASNETGKRRSEQADEPDSMVEDLNDEVEAAVEETTGADAGEYVKEPDEPSEGDGW